MPRAMLWGAAALLFLAGCGKHYWNKPGASFDDFSQDSVACAREHAMYSSSDRTYGIIRVDMYRACLQQRGWVRGQQVEPIPAGWFRGIEDDDPVRLDAAPAQWQPSPAPAPRPGRSQTDFGGVRR